MALCINQSGTYRNARTLCVNQSGTYRNIKCGCINQAATYRCFGFTAATITSFTATPSSNTTGCSTTLCWTIANATNASISPTVGTISPAVTGSSVVTPGATTTFTLSVGGGGANLTCAITYTDTGPALGSALGGGFLICKASPIRWVVSPFSTEVGTTWYCRNEAITCAQQVTGVSGWFVPSVSQLQNPGFACREFWGPHPCIGGDYWTDTQATQNAPNNAIDMGFTYGNAGTGGNKNNTRAVRAFRCVTY